MVENPPALQDTQVRPLGQEDLLEKEMATHSSIPAWRIPWIEVGYSPWGHKESDTTEWLALLLKDTLFQKIHKSICDCL